MGDYRTVEALKEAITRLKELLNINPNVKEILLGFGLHCLGCPMSQMESLEDACAVHGVSADELVEKLNNFFKDAKN